MSDRLQSRDAAKATTAGKGEISSPKPWPKGIPTEAPEKWPGKRQSNEALPDFFRRVWGKYIRKGLRMSHLKVLDPVLHSSMRGHIEAEGLPWPDDLKLMTQRTQVKEWVRAFNDGQKLKPSQLVSVAKHLRRKQQLKPK